MPLAKSPPSGAFKARQVQTSNRERGAGVDSNSSLQNKMGQTYKVDTELNDEAQCGECESRVNDGVVTM